MKAMILAAGVGARLHPVTQDTPKPALSVGKYSLIERAINKLIEHGVSDFVINVSYLSEQIKEQLESYHQTIDIQFLDEPFPYGTGGALLNAVSVLGDEPFILCNADIISDADLGKLPEHTAAAHLIGTKNPDHNAQGDFSLKEEAIFIKDGENDLTWSGLSLINPVILKEHAELLYPFDLWHTILKPLIKKSQVTAHLDDSFWIDVGTVERLKLARERLKDEN
jgi:N-acetyl-alpha-D-muramate 1-phosphate uridylyltransferase